MKTTTKNPDLDRARKEYQGLTVKETELYIAYIAENDRESEKAEGISRAWNKVCARMESLRTRIAFLLANPV